MKLKDKIIMFLATGCHVGKIPFAPGTFGSIPGLIIYYFISGYSFWVLTIAIFVFILFSIWIAQEGERIMRVKDPACIVIDEMAGVMVTVLWLPFNLITAVAGFIVFRILDIFKPFPISYFEKRFSKGMGIVMDDVAAGILGNLILRLIFYLTHVEKPL